MSASAKILDWHYRELLSFRENNLMIGVRYLLMNVNFLTAVVQNVGLDFRNLSLQNWSEFYIRSKHVFFFFFFWTARYSTVFNAHYLLSFPTLT